MTAAPKTEEKTAHTPGPWRKVGDSIYGDRAHPVHGEKEAVKIATICRMRYSFQPDDNEANHNLIAAAPEMLACLKMLTELAADYNHIGRPYDKARAAIAKAEGEAARWIDQNHNDNDKEDK